MIKSKTYKYLAVVVVLFVAWGCKLSQVAKTADKSLPSSYKSSTDTTNTVDLNWKEYFSDEHLVALIDTALKNNQELNITMQEINISSNEIQAKKGEYLPFVGVKAGSGMEKEGRYTRHGAVDEQLEIRPGQEFPEPLGDFQIGAYATWEIDIWKKLRNSKKSAISNYLASVEGKNFMVTNLIAEIAESYYELMGLDNLLDIINRNIEIQSDALGVVKQQKNAAKVTQLAVNRFEAQLLNTKNLQYEVRQNIVEVENRITFLTGGLSDSIHRSSESFNTIEIDSIRAGVPSQLLANRPDIRRAEFELAASKLDVKVAKANFYPSIGIKAGVGFQAFDPSFLFNPYSLLFNLAGDLVAPLVNRKAIKATYNSANSKQIQAIYNYEQTILNAYVDVLNQMSKLDNYSKSFETKNQEVELLMESVDIANSLFYSARADYGEVLLTQREALESKVELIEIKMKQLNAKVNIYRALGGGWN